MEFEKDLCPAMKRDYANREQAALRKESDCRKREIQTEIIMAGKRKQKKKNKQNSRCYASDNSPKKGKQNNEKPCKGK